MPYLQNHGLVQIKGLERYIMPYQNRFYYVASFSEFTFKILFQNKTGFVKFLSRQEKGKTKKYESSKITDIGPARSKY